MRRSTIVLTLWLLQAASAAPLEAASGARRSPEPAVRPTLRGLWQNARLLVRRKAKEDDPSLRPSGAASPSRAAAPEAAPAHERASLERLRAAVAAAAAVFDGSASASAAPSAAAADANGPQFATRIQLARLEQKPRAVEERFKIVIIGDAEPGRFFPHRRLASHRYFREQLARAASLSADAIIQLGDMVSKGTPAQYKAFLRTLKRLSLSIPYLTVIGNHDRRSPHGVTDSRQYEKHFGETDYFFDRGAARFVVLDTSAARLTRAQLDWLDRALDTEKRKIVLTHMPPYVPGGPLSEWTDFRGMANVGGFRPGAREFYEIVERRGVERVYLGHIHGFGMKEHRGVRYILTGGGGSPLFPSGVPKKDRFHHFIVATIGPDGIRETVHKNDGTSFELP